MMNSLTYCYSTQIGGGDLDGDMFFVTACPDIVDNVKEEAPADYPTPKQYTVRAGEDMLEHVSRDLTARILTYT